MAEASKKLCLVNVDAQTAIFFDRLEDLRNFDDATEFPDACVDAVHVVREAHNGDEMIVGPREQVVESYELNRPPGSVPFDSLDVLRLEELL